MPKSTDVDDSNQANSAGRSSQAWGWAHLAKFCLPKLYPARTMIRLEATTNRRSDHRATAIHPTDPELPAPKDQGEDLL